jgi:1,4-dihydroxy-2-naphthoate octaprenyltransferase
MVLGAYVVQTGRPDWMPLVIAVPVGFLVTAILHANNLRDMPFDRRAGIRTIAMLLGRSGARGMYAGLVLGAYLVVIGLVAARVVSPLALAALLTVPIAARNLKLVFRASEPAELAMADVMTAQLHMMFGVLMTVGVALGHVL